MNPTRAEALFVLALRKPKKKRAAIRLLPFSHAAARAPFQNLCPVKPV